MILTLPAHEQEPGDGLLNHRRLAVERQQLLGARLRLSGQKRVPTPSGKDYGIESYFLVTHRSPATVSNDWYRSIISTSAPQAPVLSGREAKTSTLRASIGDEWKTLPGTPDRIALGEGHRFAAGCLNDTASIDGD